MFCGARVPPAQGSVIVMGARVDDAIGREPVRKIHVGAGITKAELQHSQSRNVMAIAQRVNVGRDVAEVFSEERKSAERIAHPIEQIIARAVDPAAIDGGEFVGWNFPELGEAAEMIEADVIASLGGPTQAFNPPVISMSPHRVPVVKWIAPALASGTERVGWNAGDDLGSEVGLEAIEFLVGPHIGAVEINEDGNIAHHADRFAGAVQANSAPLLPKEKLDDTPKAASVCKFVARRFECSRLAPGDSTRPMAPACKLMAFPKRVVKHEIFQPPGVLLTEVIKTGSSLTRGPLGEILRGFRKQRQLGFPNLIVVNGAHFAREFRKLRAFEPAFFG